MDLREGSLGQVKRQRDPARPVALPLVVGQGRRQGHGGQAGAALQDLPRLQPADRLVQREVVPVVGPPELRLPAVAVQERPEPHALQGPAGLPVQSGPVSLEGRVVGVAGVQEPQGRPDPAGPAGYGDTATRCSLPRGPDTVRGRAKRRVWNPGVRYMQ